MNTSGTEKRFVGRSPRFANELLLFGQHKDVEWVTEFIFECFGVRIGVLATAGITLDEIRSLLPPYSKELKSGQVDRVFLVEINDTESVIFENDFVKLRFPGAHWVADSLRGQFKYCVSQLTSERVFVHAGVVAWNDCLILIPGAGFSGKTTLTAALVKAGADYYSDDFAVLDKNGLVYPYPKPLSIRRKGINSGEQIDYDVSHFGGRQAIKPLPASLVVLTQYQAGARWQPRVLTPGQGVLEIIKHTNNSLRHPQTALQVLQKVVIRAKIIQSKRGAAERAAGAILQICQ